MPTTEKKQLDEAVKEATKASDAQTKQETGESVKKAVIAREDLQKATEEAEITGADIPEMADETPEGYNTAGTHPETAQSAGKPIGAQAEPALRSKTGGSLPHGHVATGAGLVPAAAFGAGAAEAMARHGANVKRDVARERIQDEVIDRMSKPDLRLAAEARGYKIGQGGRRALSRNFREAQEADEKIARAAAGAEPSIPPASDDKW